MSIMSNITPEMIKTIEAGVDTMCTQTREGFVKGLGQIRELVPDSDSISWYYENILSVSGDPKIYIDQAVMRIGADACLELADRAEDSTPLGVYVGRFSVNHCYGSVPRKLARMAVSDAHQDALHAHNRTRAERVHAIGYSTGLLFPSDRFFERVSRVSSRFRR
jgi:hypothetical protein